MSRVTINFHGREEGGKYTVASHFCKWLSRANVEHERDYERETVTITDPDLIHKLTHTRFV